MSKTNDKLEVESSARMGVQFFLNLNPQDEGIKKVMISKYKKEIKTEDEWKTTLAEMLNKEITH